MGLALRATGRPIVYSLSNYGMYEIWKWAPSTGAQLWRTTDDIAPYVESIYAIGFGQSGLERFSGPGHWNDPDMLEIGNRDLSLDENRSHMSLWCLLAAPLMAGNDLTHMSTEALHVFTNREVIAVDQDLLGVQAHRISADGPLEVWLRPLSSGDFAVGIFNKGDSSLNATLTMRELGIRDHVRVRDLWLQHDLGMVEDKLETSTASHGVTLLRIHPELDLLP
jgi:alpha-galactosidase